ncbi:hypothetical protein EYF80_011398 [Liparis tanakae]|uniref:Uncharacterized protein n=1 Tax=Liparis tanakae TaxID=230148 RepID=A0A4Z2ILS7_9TELE|nr:hypothetical protein EYF80_011398 [Liparis tanakae]
MDRLEPLLPDKVLPVIKQPVVEGLVPKPGLRHMEKEGERRGFGAAYGCFRYLKAKRGKTGNRMSHASSLGQQEPDSEGSNRKSRLSRSCLHEAQGIHTASQRDLAVYNPPVPRLGYSRLAKVRSQQLVPGGASISLESR